MAGAGTNKAVFVTGLTLLPDGELEELVAEELDELVAEELEELVAEELEELVAEELDELVAEELEELVAEELEEVGEELEEVGEDEELLLLLPPPKIIASMDCNAANPILPCAGTTGAMWNGLNPGNTAIKQIHYYRLIKIPCSVFRKM
jgi:hypothetical protein